MRICTITNIFKNSFLKIIFASFLKTFIAVSEIATISFLKIYMPNTITIGDKKVRKGEKAEIPLHIERLPTHTLIQIPVSVFSSKEDGPTLLLCGGMHRDELNGIEIVRRIISTGRAVPDIGTVI